MTERRLAAVLAADAVGFSSRMAQDEAGAIRAISACLEALGLVVGLHGGRVVKTLGDGLLAEFGSAVGAVSAAAAMQTRLAERARDLGPQDAFAFRIGVHSGDVAVIGDDLLGDGVNVAARLEGVAPPGGVLISRRVHEDVAGRLDLTFEDRGDLVLKGLGRPVRAYALGGGERAAVPHAAPSLPEKPSLAVLPFANLSSDPEQEFFADGLTEDLITALAGVPWLFVIARNSSFVYKGGAVDVRRVGRELGVAYVLEGSVRRAGPRLRVTGQLIDAATGAHLWAERMDGALEDVFDLQDRVTEAVVQAIAPGVREAEMARAVAARPESLTIYDRFLKALAKVNQTRLREAILEIDEVVSEAPGYARAAALRAWLCTLQDAWLAEDDNDGRARVAGDLAERALASAPGDVEVMALSGYALGFFGLDVHRGMALVAEATERSPSYAWAWASLGMLESLQGSDTALADAHADRALRLSPRDPLAFRNYVTKSRHAEEQGRHDDAVEMARMGQRQRPGMAILHVIETRNLQLAGRTDEAREAARRLLGWLPDFRVSVFAGHHRRFHGYAFNNAQFFRPLIEAGLPE